MQDAFSKLPYYLYQVRIIRIKLTDLTCSKVASAESVFRPEEKMARRDSRIIRTEKGGKLAAKSHF